MAVIATDDLTDLRHRLATAAGTVTWTKVQVNAALQAIEDAMTGATNVGAHTVPQYIGLAIEQAAPGVFSAGQKQTLFIAWSLLNARRGGIG